MTLWKVLFKPLSPFTSKIEVYTLFGALCWGYKLLFGEERLLEFLEKFKNDPPFLLSSPLPHFNDLILFPMPQIEEGFLDDSELPYPEKKEYKKIKYIPQNLFLEYLEGKIRTQGEIFLKLKELKKNENECSLKNLLEKPFIFNSNILQASINRLTWTTTGGNLINTPAYWYSSFIVYVLQRDSQFDIEILKKLFELVSLGGNKSIGWGHVKIVKIEEDKALNGYLEPRSEFFYILSPTFIDPSFEIEESYYQLFIYTGLIENFYERLTHSLLKRRFIYLSSGSQIKTGQIKACYGGLIPALEGTSFAGNGRRYTIYQYGYAFPLYLKGDKA